MKIDDMKSALSKCTQAKRGAFGEKLYTAYLSTSYIGFTKLHKDGADFQVNGIGRVDLKTRKKLSESANGKITLYRHKLKNTTYAYLTLWKDSITLDYDFEGRVNHIAMVEWSVASQLVDHHFFDNSDQTLVQNEMEPRNADELKVQLRIATNPRLGRFGEKIYRSHMEEHGYSVKPLHEQKADFFVDGFGRVDVKTKGLGKSTPRVKHRINKIIYCFVDLEQEFISLTHEDAEGNIIGERTVIEWDVVFSYWNQLPYRLVREQTEFKEQLQEQTNDLKNWIAVTWGKRAVVVYRQGYETQKSMTSGKKPWGPDTFFESPTAKRKIDLKVLIYFDGVEIYKIMAYPIHLRSDIHWIEGRINPSKASFDPSKIDEKFVFSGLSDFKLSFPRRFLLNQ